MEKTDYSEWLARLMGKAGESQYSLAAKSGVPQPTIQRILSGETRSPKTDTIRKLLGALGYGPDALLTAIGAEGNGEAPAGGSAEPGPDGLPFAGTGLTQQERALLGNFRRMTAEQRENLVRESEEIKRGNERIIQELARKKFNNGNAS